MKSSSRSSIARSTSSRAASATWARATARCSRTCMRSCSERTARGGMLDEHPLIVVGADFNTDCEARDEADAARGRHPRVPRDPRRHQSAGTTGERSGDARPRRPRSAAHPVVSGSQPAVHAAGELRERLAHAAHDRRVRVSGGGDSGRRARGESRPASPPVGALHRQVRPARAGAAHAAAAGAAANLDRTPAVAYDGTHGFSDQYLVELPVFLECAREAGLAG